MFKTANIGNADRIVRLVAGIVLLLVPFVMTAPAALLAWGAPIVGLVLVATGFVRFCPAYAILGIKTCSI